MKRKTWSLFLGAMLALGSGGLLIGCSDDDGGGGAVCGNGVLEGQEACDASNLAGTTCEDLGYTGGTLACTDNCEFDESGCNNSLCGNGQLDPGEDCDGTELDGETCTDQGFAGGVLACTLDCTFDTSACTGGCGNGVVEDDEECDVDDLGGESCDSLGYSGGSLDCNTDCTFDTAACDAPTFLCTVDENAQLDVGDVLNMSVDTNSDDNSVDVSCEAEELGAAEHIWAIDVASDGDLVVTTPGDWHVFALFSEPSDVGDCFSSGEELGCYDAYFDGPNGVFPDLTAGTYYLVVSDYNSESSLELDFTVALYGQGTEICNNGVDDDNDGDVDCDDSDCDALAYCADEVCDNGSDDDADGYADCLDSDCVGDAACTGGVCAADLELGTIDSSDTYDATFDTSAASDDLSMSCATNGAGDYVVSFSLDWPATVNVDLTQAAEDDNYLGFFYEGGSGNTCLDQESLCLLANPTSGYLTLPVAPLQPGNYFFIVEANGTGGEVQVSFSVAMDCPEGRHVEDGECVYDTCASLDCGSMHMLCDDSSVPAVCSGCESGYVEDYGRCIVDGITYGDACEMDADCPGTGDPGSSIFCDSYTGGACTSVNAPECATPGQPCTDDPDSMCVQVDSMFGTYFFCMEGCTDDTDCRPGYFCNDNIFEAGFTACDQIQDCGTYGCNDSGNTLYCNQDQNSEDYDACWVDACAADPCNGVANSTGTCLNDKDGYACECDSTHMWNPDTMACDPFTCGAVDLGTWNGTAIQETGDSCNGTTIYGNATLGCTSYAASSNELVYSLTVPNGETIDVTMTPDGNNDQDSSLYILEACNDLDGATCLVGVDEAGSDAETVSWTNNTGGSMTVYIIADAYSGCGALTLDIQ